MDLGKIVFHSTMLSAIFQNKKIHRGTLVSTFSSELRGQAVGTEIKNKLPRSSVRRFAVKPHVSAVLRDEELFTPETYEQVARFLVESESLDISCDRPVSALGCYDVYDFCGTPSAVKLFLQSSYVRPNCVLRLSGYGNFFTGYFGNVAVPDDPALLRFAIRPADLSLSARLSSSHENTLLTIATAFTEENTLLGFFKRVLDHQDACATKQFSAFSFRPASHTSYAPSFATYDNKISTKEALSESSSYDLLCTGLNERWLATTSTSLSLWLNVFGLDRKSFSKKVASDGFFLATSWYFLVRPVYICRFEDTGLEVLLNFIPSWNDLVAAFRLHIREGLLLKNVIRPVRSVFSGASFVLKDFDYVDPAKRTLPFFYLCDHLWLHEARRQAQGELLTAWDSAFEENLTTPSFQNWLTRLDERSTPIGFDTDFFFRTEWPIWLRIGLSQLANGRPTTDYFDRNYPSLSY